LSLEYTNITVPPIVKQILTLCLSPNDEPYVVCRGIYDLIRESGYINDGRPPWSWPVSEWWTFGYVASHEDHLDYLISLIPSVVGQVSLPSELPDTTEHRATVDDFGSR
jgi:hypothetical protein